VAREKGNWMLFVKKNFIGWAVIKYFIMLGSMYTASPSTLEKKKTVPNVVLFSGTGEEKLYAAHQRGEFFP
jgi:hypothetical protein